MKAVGDGDDFVPCVLTRKEKVTIQWSGHIKRSRVCVLPLRKALIHKIANKEKTEEGLKGEQ